MKLCSIWIIGILLILIAAMRPVGLDGDSINYASIAHLNWDDANFSDKEPFFWVINQLNNSLLGGYIGGLFFIFAALAVIIKMYAVKKLSLFPFFSIYIYIAIYFILHEMTQIRVGVASGIFLLAIPDLINKNRTNYIFKSIIATLFHYLSIVMIIFLFFDVKKIDKKVYFSIPLLSILASFLLQVNDIINISSIIFPNIIYEKIINYSILLSNGNFSELNKYNLYSIFTLIIYYFFLIIDNYKTDYDIILIKIFCISISSFYLFSDFPVIAFRLSEFLGVSMIILIPNIMSSIRNKKLYKSLLFIALTIYLFVISIGRNLNIDKFL